MNFYIGIDLGTSATKGILVNGEGVIVKEESANYPPYEKELPSGWSEHHPEYWFEAVKIVLRNLSEGLEEEVKGISFGGQMHGLVALDKDDNVIRPCILWNDGRTEEETKYLNEVVGREALSAHTGNIAFAGFTAPKLLWLKKHEPQNFAKIAKIMLPKDYIAYMLTGVFSTDYSDASGTLLLDVEHKCWSKELCEICSVVESWLPKLYESYEVTGKVKAEFGLPNAVVTAGAGDNAAAAVGTGTVGDGSCNISLGTSGTIFLSQDSFSVDEKNALHSFVHANGKYHLMGCILSAASANQWWIENILSDRYDIAERMGEKLGKNEVYFLPYLMGERSPHNDVNARGAFIGMNGATTKEEMSLAVLEGVAFAFRDCLEVAKENGLVVKESNLCGGGAKSKIWRTILANVLGVKIDMVETEQGPSFGGAMLAMVGAGEYASVEEAVSAIVKSHTVALPEPALQQAYEEKYRKFKKLYPALKSAFADLAQ